MVPRRRVAGPPPPWYAPPSRTQQAGTRHPRNCRRSPRYAPALPPGFLP